MGYTVGTKILTEFQEIVAVSLLLAWIFLKALILFLQAIRLMVKITVRILRDLRTNGLSMQDLVLIGF